MNFIKNTYERIRKRQKHVFVYLPFQLPFLFLCPKYKQIYFIVQCTCFYQNKSVFLQKKVRASNFFGGPVTFKVHWPPGPVDTKRYCRPLTRHGYVCRHAACVGMQRVLACSVCWHAACVGMQARASILCVTCVSLLLISKWTLFQTKSVAQGKEDRPDSWSDRGQGGSVGHSWSVTLLFAQIEWSLTI